jgi:carbonic anhydrase
MSEIDRLLAWNHAHPDKSAHPGVGPELHKRLVVVTCIDMRLITVEILGVGLGDVQCSGMPRGQSPKMSSGQ